VNERIRISPVRLIDDQDRMVGIIETHEALRMAREAGLDLVEVAADSKPPVCRILDFGKWKYEQARKDKATKARSKSAELKEVRLGRSMKIDPHDVEIRIRQARKFLMEGHKVQIVQNFRGREVQHKGRGDQRMQDIIEQLSEVGKVEVAPRLNGRRMIMIFAPDKAKIEQVRRREGAARPAASAEPAEDAEHAERIAEAPRIAPRPVEAHPA
jgi:translation initiation factor IF-3